jgi:hypothetical protein
MVCVEWLSNVQYALPVIAITLRVVFCQWHWQCVSWKFNFLPSMTLTFRDPSWSLEGSKTLPYHFTMLQRAEGSSQCTWELSKIAQEHLTTLLWHPWTSTNLHIRILCSSCLADVLQASLPIGIMCDYSHISCCQFIAATIIVTK